MQFSLQKIRIAAFVALFGLATSAAASAQTGNPIKSFIGGASVYQTNEVEELYESNSQLPLGGFFAKGFTRTFTLLGGANFTAADLPGDFEGALGDAPLTQLFNGAPPVESDNNDVGYVISVAMGRRHNRRLRSEFEFAIRGNDLDLSLPVFIDTDVEADVNAYSIMKNVIFDFPNQSRFTPYLGAGLGISLVEVEAQITTSPINSLINSANLTPNPSFTSTPTSNAPPSEVSEEDAALSYQFIGGVATRVNHAMDFVVEYRFFGTSDIELDTLGSAPYLVNNLFLGVKLEY